MPRGIIESCDVYIHQDIRAENKYSYYLSDNYILPKLKDSCLAVTVPNLVGFGEPYFVTVDSAHSKVKVIGNNQQIAPWYNDFLIDEAYRKELRTVSRIKKHVLREDAYPNEKIVEIYSYKMEKLKEREKGWDIKISHFIEENYKTSKIFYDVDHPTNNVLIEICRKLGHILGLTDWDTAQPDIDLGWREQFVWPCVRKALGLQWEDQYVRNNGKYPYIKLADGQLDVDEYIRQYVFWQYGQYLY